MEKLTKKNIGDPIIKTYNKKFEAEMMPYEYAEFWDMEPVEPVE